MKNLFLGIEIGGTKLQLGLGTDSGKIIEIYMDNVDPEKGSLGIREWLKKYVPSFIQKAEREFGLIKAVGCGFGGPINSSRGRVLKSIQISGWEDFPIQEWLQETFSLPTIVINDSNAATWGEYCKGYGKGCRYFFYVNIGSGVGGGFVFDGKLYNGQGFGAGEFGHTFVPDWTSETTGDSEEIENLCSGWAIESRLNRSGYVPRDSLLFPKTSSVTTSDLADAARKGDRFALKEIDLIASSIGLGLANVLCLTGVERIAVGGGVSKMGNLLIDPIRAHTRNYAFIINQGHYEINQCLLGDSIVLVGSILLAKQFFNTL